MFASGNCQVQRAQTIEVFRCRTRPAGQQQGGGIPMSRLCSDMQWSSGHVTLCVCNRRLIKQQPKDLTITCVRSNVGRGRAIQHACHGIGLALQQQLNQWTRPSLYCHMQRSFASVSTCIDVRAMVQERPCNLEMSSSHGQEKCSHILLGLQFNTNSSFQKQINNLYVTTHSCGMEHGDAGAQGHMRIGTLLQQELQHLPVAPLCRQKTRSVFICSPCFFVCAPFHQSSGNCTVPASCSQMQWRGTLVVLGARFGTLL
mmetsp:Transcript_87710/g.174072  ORF Transcript_87710/g.174072 Transcript_87710/m.174072 type:complete len:258 (-) Transcript_87710:402-1175(-)